MVVQTIHQNKGVRVCKGPVNDWLNSRLQIIVNYPHLQPIINGTVPVGHLRCQCFEGIHQSIVNQHLLMRTQVKPGQTTSSSRG